MTQSVSSRPRVALCLFGLPRRLSQTARSIEVNLIAPLAEQADVTLLAHANSAPEEDVSAEELAERFALDGFRSEPPNACLERWDFEALCRYGDYWQNDFASLRRLIHQLHSLHQMTEMAQEAGVDHVFFVRSDLLFHDSLEPCLPALLAEQGDHAYLPDWQHWKGGLNDRFAYCTGWRSARAYGQRILKAHDFCRQTGAPLHAEQLVAFALWTARVQHRTLPLRASRVRAHGAIVDEDFGSHRMRKLRQKLLLRAQWLRQGIRPGAPDACQSA